jgi:integrase
MPSLSKRTVEAAKPRDREYVLWDDSVPGFGLRVYPSGKRSYCIQYRSGGRTRRMALGLHGVLTPTQARQRAQELLSEAKLGGDPSAERTAYRTGATITDLAEKYLAEHAEPRIKPSSVHEFRRILRLYILPSLGSRRVADIARTDAERLHTSMSKTPFIANRTLGLLQSMLTIAERWEMRPDNSNPCKSVPRFPEPRRERFLTDAEFTQLGEALREIEESNPKRWGAVAAIRLMILTGARRNEILTLKWDYIDWKYRELHLPDSKTGPKTIVLSGAALLVLEGVQKRRVNVEWVIPGRKPSSHLADIMQPWREIRAAAGIEDVRLHDLRHSFASAGARAGLSLPVIGALLGQSQAGTTERYSHLARDPIHAANDMIGARIAAALDGKPDADVVPLRRGG